MKKTDNRTEIIPYPLLRGMDLRGEGGLAYLENMYIDYDGSGDAVESIVGYRQIIAMKDKIHSFCLICEGEESRIVLHSGGGLYLGSVAEREVGVKLARIAELEDGESYAMPLGNFCLITDGKRLISVNRDGEVTAVSEESSLAGCRCAAVYDGRIFLSGNPACEGKIFFSNTIFEGNISFTESISTVCGNILSLTALDGYLAVFHSGGAIFYKTSEDGGYTAARTVDQPGIRSNTVALDHELIFMTDEGLISLNIPTDGCEVKSRCHSEKINRLLLRDGLEGVKLNIWMGYIVVSRGEKIYLADPRGKGGYGWYPITGVGGYEKDKRVYRYRREAEEHCEAHSTPDERAVGEIYSYGREDGSLVYYSVEGEKRYSVYPTAELCGGEFYAVTDTVCHGGLMWFCAGKRLYLFNSDRRGKDPEEAFANNYPVSDISLTDGRIHPIYYSFAGHAPRYAAITRPRELRPTRKSCRARSTVNIRIKALSAGEIRLIDVTDGIKVSDRKICLDKLQKSDKSKAKSTAKNAEKTPSYTAEILTASLPDRAKEGEILQLCVTTDGFASPFGIDRIEYRGATDGNSKPKKGEYR